MKVVFCTREYAELSGGHNTWLGRFLPYLHRHGIEPRVLCFPLTADKEFPTVRSLRQAGLSCQTVSEEEAEYTEQRVRWILERVSEDPPDVFVANAVIPAAYYAGRWLREAGIPTVGICHVGGAYPLYKGLLDQFVFGEVSYRVSAFVCVSKHLEQMVNERNPGILVRNIPCGIPIPERIAKTPDGRLRLAYVGRLIEEPKRISETTHALCRTVREIPGTEAVIYGDGPDRAAVEQVLREDGEGLPVYLAGFLENDLIQKRLLECHAVVLLSDHEGLGLSLLEGMASGVVPIALRGAPGVTEFVVDNVTGLLVENRGDSFVAAIRRLREDPALWARLSRSARMKAEAEYSEEKCAERWQEVLKALLHRTGSRKPLRIPRRIHLPPVHPDFVFRDKRVRQLHQRLMRPVKRYMIRMKYQYPSIFSSH